MTAKDRLVSAGMVSQSHFSAVELQVAIAVHDFGLQTRFFTSRNKPLKVTHVKVELPMSDG